MTPEEEARVLAYAQHVSRHYISYRGPLPKIVESIIYAMGDNAPPADRIDNFLRREKTQLTLAGRYETALWHGVDKSWHLVSLAIPVDPAIARRRLAYRPDSPGSQCAWCYQDEKGFAAESLTPVLNLKREQIPGRYCHPHCLRAFMALIYLVERADLESRHPQPKPEQPAPIIPTLTAPPTVTPPPRKRGRPAKGP